MVNKILVGAVMALVLTAMGATRAAAQNPFIIDGVIPANGSPSGPAQTPDPFGATKELGPVNGNATKVGVIHTAVPPMLDFTNPNGQVDLRNIWTQTSKTLNGNIWFYFAWERDANTGSGFIAYEFQQSALSPSCAYTAAGIDMIEPQSLAETALINSCNPWRNRQPGDFLILWDQSGSALAISKRVFSLSGGQLVLGPVQALGSAVAAISADGFRGEAAINLTTDVFPPDGSCVSFANIIPGTVTGNSDSADYKDTVLAPFAPISSCGTVTVTKVTNPGGLKDGTFPYTLKRADGSAIRFDGTLAINQTLTFDGDSTGSPIQNLVAGTNYTLTEAPQTSPWQLQSISCKTDSLPPVDLTSGGTFVVEANTLTACTITNRRLRGSIRVIKRVINDNGGTAQASAFTITLGDSANTTFGGVESPGIQNTFDHGYAYNVTEIALPIGYAMTGMTGECSGAIVADVTKVCTITNDDVAPRLTVIKRVVNDNGGSATANQWTMNVAATSPSQASFPGAEGGTTISLNAGSFNVTETGGPIVGYSQTSAVGCSGTIAVGETKTCTITNDDQPARLTVIKHVINDNGGTATANQWTMNVAATNPSTPSFAGAEAPGTTISLNVGSFNVTESGGPAGYTQTGAVGCSGTVAVGESKTCTLTNNDIPPQLIVIKHVINDNGGTATANQWTMNVAATDPSKPSFPGAEAPGTTITLNVGSFNVTETGGPSVGYAQTNAVGCSGTIAIGESKTCTITNDDIAPRLTVIKHVINDNGGAATANQWAMNVTATNPSAASFPGAEAPGTTITLNAGSFGVAESGGPDGYVQTSAVGCSGTIAVGETKTCTITNDDLKANPTAATFMGWVLHDSATVTGIRFGAPDASSATVTFRLYGPGDTSCSTPINGAGEVRPLAGGTASTAAGFTITQAQAGQYRWIAVYSGDQFNSPSATACGAETHTITVQSPQ